MRLLCKLGPAEERPGKWDCAHRRAYEVEDHDSRADGLICSLLDHDSVEAPLAAPATVDISVFNFEYFSTRCSASSFVLPYGLIGLLSASSVIGVSNL